MFRIQIAQYTQTQHHVHFAICVFVRDQIETTVTTATATAANKHPPQPYNVLFDVIIMQIEIIFGAISQSNVNNFEMEKETMLCSTQKKHRTDCSQQQ